MTLREINNMIESIGVPYAYYQFPEGTEQQTPFICFYYPANDDLIADNANYQKINQLIKRYEEARKMMKQMMKPGAEKKMNRMFRGF